MDSVKKSAFAEGFSAGKFSIIESGKSLGDLSAKFDRLSENLARVFGDGSSAAAKGSGGEMSVQQYIQSLIPYAEIKVTNSNTAEMDFIVITEGISIAVDVKNRKTPVPKADRDKFERDVLQNRNSVHAFIMVSVQEDIAISNRGTLFQKAHIGTYPVIYLSRCFADQGLALAVCILHLTHDLKMEQKQDSNSQRDLVLLRQISTQISEKMKETQKSVTSIARESQQIQRYTSELSQLQCVISDIVLRLLPDQPVDVTAKKDIPKGSPFYQIQPQT